MDCLKTINCRYFEILVEYPKPQYCPFHLCLQIFDNNVLSIAEKQYIVNHRENSNCGSGMIQL
jgi:hypothetical protein